MSRPPRPSGTPHRRGLSPEAVRDTVLEGTPLPLLRALGLCREDGSATADAHRKIKQISHFARLVEAPLRDLFARQAEPVLVDAAAGKAYLGLALYARWVAREGRGRLIAVESRPDLAARVRALAAELGYDRLEVVQAPVAAAPLPERLHFVVALHACDTATDEALLRALQGRADHVALVPCCQAEVARQLAEVHTGPSYLWRDAWHRREFGAHLTNVLRTLLLRSHGHQVTVTELAGWEHSVKNELILGRRVGRYHAGARAELEALLGDIPVRPWVLDAVARWQAASAEAEARAAEAEVELAEAPPPST